MIAIIFSEITIFILQIYSQFFNGLCTQKKHLKDLLCLFANNWSISGAF